MRSLLLLSLTILSCWAGEAEPPKLPADAQAAIDRADKAVAVAQSRADAEILKIRQALIRDLTRAQETATRRGDLVTAMAIKDQIDSVEMPELLDTRRINPARFKSYSVKDWETFPGTVVTANAESYTTAATLEKNQEAILLPHPGDQWASHSAGSRFDYKGGTALQKGLPSLGMIVKVGDSEEQAIDPSKLYAGPGSVILSCNDGTMSNNIGSIRVKVIIQLKR